MYIETSYPQAQGDKARLMTPMYEGAATGYCANWYYHMLGIFLNFNNLIWNIIFIFFYKKLI